MKNQETIQAVAYHEAGHAALSLCLKVDFDYVTIIADKEKFSLGQVSSTPWDDEDYIKLKEDATFLRLKTETQCIILYAGPLAEKKFTGHFNQDGAAMDFDQIKVFCDEMFSDDVTEAYLNYIKTYVESMFANGVWEWVEKIAKALLERNTLTYKEVHDVIHPPLPEFKITKKA